jgi:type II secretory pathway component PulF
VQAAEMLAAEWESEAKASSAVLGTQLTHTDRAVFSERLATVTGHAMALRRALASPSETRPAESHNPKET